MPDDIDTETLAEEVLAELDPGTRIEDKFILSRRQLLAIAGGSGAVGLLTQLGIDEAEAQSAAGQVGTSSEPVDVYAAGGGNVELDGDVTSTSVSGGYDVTIDGDTYEFRS